MLPVTLDSTRVDTPLKISVATQPAVEPVSYQELADFLRLATTDDRALVNMLEIAGRKYIEKLTRKTIITTTFNQYWDFFPASLIIAGRPLQAINSIQWTDQTGTVQTLATNKYLVDNQGPRPIVIPPLGFFFPIAKVQTPNSVVVNFTAGITSDPTQVPETLKLLIKQWVALNYNQREAVVLGKVPAKVPHTFDALLSIEKLWEV